MAHIFEGYLYVEAWKAIHIMMDQEAERTLGNKGWTITFKVLPLVVYLHWSLKVPCGFKIVLLPGGYTLKYELLRDSSDSSPNTASSLIFLVFLLGRVYVLHTPRTGKICPLLSAEL